MGKAAGIGGNDNETNGARSQSTVQRSKQRAASMEQVSAAARAAKSPMRHLRPSRFSQVTSPQKAALTEQVSAAATNSPAHVPISTAEQ